MHFADTHTFFKAIDICINAGAVRQQLLNVTDMFYD